MALAQEAKERLGKEVYEKFLSWCGDNTITTKNILEIGKRVDGRVYGDLQRMTKRYSSILILDNVDIIVKQPRIHTAASL